MRKSKRGKTRNEGIQIEYISGTGWIHTHGMDAAGLPEVEIRHVPAFLAEAAANLVNMVCDHMLDTGTRIEPGQVIAASPRTHFRLVSPDPMPGNEDHYAVERLQIVDIQPSCGCFGLTPYEQN